MKSPLSPAPRRLAGAARGGDPAVLRAASQLHLDSRLARLEAYEATLVTSLRQALDKDAAGADAARFERQLGQVRKDVLAASRPRLPRVQPTAPPAQAAV